jgi:hypothetical protein
MDVVAVQAEVQYQPAQIAERRVRIGTAVLPCGLSAVLDERERLLVVVHGALRDAGNYLAQAQAAAREHASRTLIVAPQFLADVDLRGNPEPGLRR